ncbi:hypothetical protein SAMN05444365_105103 [Micromonospora pattaloongensis]|uniref:Uncharacterized protein n=1 Tax=Micromonospora pattaloongensis TaxID=405436 RepID=A0A1H3PYF1_9ACTN|nr:hypothetical protein [Micromonospora pattaloongensis]SDZ05971.1 hypothetical protein SAMN05444365_105103 [Micromonospora pattaloongensis]
MRERELRCAICAAEMLFEAPPCADGHDGDCPELICTGCGTAVLVAAITVPRPRRTGTARSRRHAA